MKRLTAIVLVLTLCILTGCGNQTVGGEDTSLDFDRNFIRTKNSFSFVCGTSDTLYYVLNGMNYIYYIDKATGISGPLCGKPECGHNGSNCNAYISGKAWGLAIYGGRLYWVSGSGDKYIYSAALDGTDRRKERTLERDLFPSSVVNPYIIFHRGYAYLSCLKQEIENGAEAGRDYICAFPLDEEEDAFTILDEIALSGEYSNYAASRISIQPYGDELYILTDRLVYEDSTKTSYDFEIRQWDIETREMESLYSEKDSPLSSPSAMWVTDDGIVFTRVSHELVDGAWVNETHIYQYDFGAGEIRELSWLGTGNTGLADNIVVKSRSSNEQLYINIMDFDGSVLLEDTYPLNEFEEFHYKGAHLYYMGIDDRYAYFSTSANEVTETYTTDYYAIIAVALDGSGAQVLSIVEETEEVTGVTIIVPRE